METEAIMLPVHPGEAVLENFLKPLSLSQYQLAKEIGVPARRINEIVHGPAGYAPWPLSDEDRATG